MNSDLVVVVADGGIEQAMRGILSRPQSIGIRSLRGVEYPKVHRLDQGVFHQGHELAAAYRRTHEHALLMLDLAWNGRPTNDAAEMSRLVEARLQGVWGDAGRCIVIDPELEVWVWSDSPHVADELGWGGEAGELRPWLENQGLWSPQAAKPSQPREAYLRAIREKQIGRSNATFRAIAERVSLRRCRDAAFLRLLEILRAWFPSSTPRSSEAAAEST